MSQAGRFTPEVVPGTYIEQINGDVGFVSGAIVSFNATPVSGSSLSFSGFGTTMLFEVTDSNVNTLVGNNAGNNSITGIQNTSLGSTTLTTLTTGSQNVMVGVGAGDQLLTGSYNIGIGFDAGDSYIGSESSNIVFNNTGTVGESHTLRVGAGTGAGNGQLNRAFISGIEGITVATADQVLVINSSDQISAVAPGTSGQIFTSQGAGSNPIWANNAAILTINGDVGSVTGNTIAFHGTPTSGSSVQFSGSGTTMSFNVTDSLSNTIIGNDAGNPIITGQFNTVLGAASGQGITSAVRTVAVGYFAAPSVTSGGGNVAVGYYALNQLSTGDYNTAIGTFAAETLTSGSEHNVAIGLQALNTGGISSYNVAIGTQALTADNSLACVAIGYHAVSSDDGGIEGITAVGYESLMSAATGFNTAVGYKTLSNVIAGTNNVAVGHDVGPTLVSGTSNIYIGNIDAVSSSESNTTRIGNEGNTSSCYILGIGGVDVGATANVVVEDNDQLGTAVLVAGTNIFISTAPNVITISADPAVIANYVTVNSAASPYTVLADDYYISADVTAGTVTIRLPNAPTIGRTFVVKDKVGLSATNNITVTTVGGVINIDGATTFVMNTAYEAISLIFNGLTYEVF